MDQRETETNRLRVICTFDPLDVGLCNCASCGETLIGERTYRELIGFKRATWPHTARDLFAVCKRLVGEFGNHARPYCRECVSSGRAYGASS